MAIRRFAIFSDIHGNSVALDAVLDEIRGAGVEEMYCLGDLVGYGPDPIGVVQRIRDLGIPTVRGNYDDGIGARRGDCGCYYATDEARVDGMASYAFTDAALDDASCEWLAALPDHIRFEHDGARILLAHGSPRKINEYLLPDREDAQLARLAEQAATDVACVGHVHIPYHRTLHGAGEDTIHYVSSGSVGKPKDKDPRACWVEVVLGSSDEVAQASRDAAAAPVGATDLWLGVVVHRVEYDIEAVAEAMVAAGLPVRLAEALRNA